jgi:hypothetical protein
MNNEELKQYYFNAPIAYLKDISKELKKRKISLV